MESAAVVSPSSELILENIITKVVQVPGVKVDRNQFLKEAFVKENADVSLILKEGPVCAGCSREMLSRMANKLILKRTSESSVVSFAMGLPGGIAAGVSIPADVAQFFGMSMRLAQELAYLYGAPDLWKDDELDSDAVKNQLIMYCGVMFGVAGASAGVRLLSAQIAKTTLKKLPQQALTKTVWYPVVKQIGKLVGVKITKSTVAKGASKAIPVVGGVIAGGLNFASMMPMAKRLLETLDGASFGYTEEEILADYQEVQAMADGQQDAQPEKESVVKNAVGSMAQGMKGLGAGVSGFLSKRKEQAASQKETPANAAGEILATIEKLAALKETGVLTQEEFETKKAELLSKL